MNKKGEETYELLNKAWKSTTKIVFGSEIGELSEYSEWLSEMSDPVYMSPSFISGKDVAFSSNEYEKDSRRIGFEEIDFGKKFEPLNINEIKDIESLSGAISERVVYTGNLVLGNSKFVEKSSNVSDSFYVYESSRVGDSKYVAFASMIRGSEYIFGSAAPGESSHCIRCNDEFKVKRCFELWMSCNSSDCYYDFNLNNCSDVMFSFNLRSKRHAIGNVELEKSKYLRIKESLLEQMRQELMKKKRLPSLLDYMRKSECRPSEAKVLLEGRTGEIAKEGSDMEPIETAFSRTTRLILGSRLKGVDSYSNWLKAHNPREELWKSAISGISFYVADYSNYLDVPRSRAILEEEALSLVAHSPQRKGIESISLDNAHEFIGGISYVPLKFREGTNRNMIDCTIYGFSNSCYRSTPVVHSKDCAFNFWLRNSESAFGCGVLFDSSFCINCYQSVKLTRCLEVDASRDCSDSYFLHNCENVHDSMFCFNIKNMRNAIGNSYVGKDKYERIKEAILKQICGELEKKKSLSWDIYNIGATKK